MELREFFSEDAVELELEGNTKDEILKELIALLKLDDKSEGMLFKMLKRRENLGSTGTRRRSRCRTNTFRFSGRSLSSARSPTCRSGCSASRSPRSSWRCSKRRLSSGSLRGHSHSIVAGGFELTSYTTRLMPVTSLIIRLEILASTSYGN